MVTAHHIPTLHTHKGLLNKTMSQSTLHFKGLNCECTLSALGNLCRCVQVHLTPLFLIGPMRNLLFVISQVTYSEGNGKWFMPSWRNYPGRNKRMPIHSLKELIILKHLHKLSSYLPDMQTLKSKMETQKHISPLHLVFFLLLQLHLEHIKCYPQPWRT